MVQINYRIHYGIPSEILLQFFKDIGYGYRGKNKKSIKKGGERVVAHEFLRTEGKGRFHIFVEFGYKTSGTEAYPLAKLYAHYELVKNVRGREVHIPIDDKNFEMEEMYRIHRKLKERKFGFMEHKDIYCAHGTHRIEAKKKLLEIITRDYPENYDILKYRRREDNVQYVISIIEQYKYLHIILVCAHIEGKEHILQKEEAEAELNRIFEEVEHSKNREAFQKIKEIEKDRREVKVKINSILEQRDSHNKRTAELIEKIRELDANMKDNTNAYVQRKLSMDKKILGVKLRKNKKLANKFHYQFIELTKERQKLSKQQKQLTKKLYE